MISSENLQKYSVGDQDSQQSLHSVHSKKSIIVDLNKLSPAIEIPQKVYSVQADMITGWKPKIKKEGSQIIIIPTLTRNPLVDQIVEAICNRKIHSLKIVYLGRRWENSYQIHQSLCKVDSSHHNPYLFKLSQKSDRRLGLCPTNRIKTLQFTSQIQCGNLDVAIRKNEMQYDLFMRVDTNTKGHTSWYNFVVRNHSLVGKVKFNIMNFRKKRSLYQRKMRPYIKSLKHQKEWSQQGQVHYYKQAKPLFYQVPGLRTNIKVSRNYSLSFSYEFTTENDEVQIAYSVPYPLSRLNKLIQQIKDKPYVEISCLTKSLSQIKIPLISITDDSQEKKKVVVISARVHPGQTNGSFVAEGLIRALCSQDPLTKKIRKQFHFKIVPMLNPDGVIAGNYRTGIIGVDLNRVYDKDKAYYPQIRALKNLLKCQAKRIQHPVHYYIDLHGHSIKKNIFLYGPQHQLNSTKYTTCRLLAKHLSNLTSMFRYYSCIWRISQGKQNTARAIFSKKLHVSNCYTLQSSNGLYYDRNSKQQKQFNESSWMSMGSILVRGIYESSLQITKQKEQSKNIRSKRQSKRLQQISTSVKLDQQMVKCSDDQLSEGESDSEPEDKLELQQLIWLRQQLVFKDKRQVSYNNSKSRHYGSQSQKKYSTVHPKAKTSLAMNQQQIKLPIIIHQSNRSQSLKQKKAKQSIVLQKPITSRINMSELIQKRKIVRQSETGFASIMNRMVLNFSLNQRVNCSTKSIKQVERKSVRYANKSLGLKQPPKPNKFIQNLRFQ